MRRKLGASGVWKVVALAVKQSSGFCELEGLWSTAGKTRQMPHVLGCRAWKEISPCWEFWMSGGAIVMP
jgi:hypothetical protein